MSFYFILPTVQKVKLNYARVGTKQSRCRYKMCVGGNLTGKKFDMTCKIPLVATIVFSRHTGTTLTRSRLFRLMARNLVERTQFNWEKQIPACGDSD